MPQTETDVKTEKRAAEIIPGDMQDWILETYTATPNGWKLKVGGRACDSSKVRTSLEGAFPDADILPSKKVLDMYRVEVHAAQEGMRKEQLEAADGLPQLVYDYVVRYMCDPTFERYDHIPEIQHDLLHEKYTLMPCKAQVHFADVCNNLQTLLEIYNSKIPIVTDPTTGATKKLFPDLRYDRVTSALSSYELFVRNSAEMELQEKVRHRPELKAKLEDHFRLMLEAIDADGDPYINSIVLAHWLWQVKRKIYGLEVKDHLVLSIYGPGGIGKSTWIYYLASCLGPLGHAEARITSLKGSFDLLTLVGLAYIAEFPEIGDPDSKSGGKALDAGLTDLFKGITTGKQASGREMRSQRAMKKDIRASFIVSTNHHIYDIVVDDGYRRFFEFSPKLTGEPTTEYKTKLYAKQEEMRKIILEVWQGIDENHEGGYLRADPEAWKKIMAIQSTYVRKKPAKVWMESYGELFNNSELDREDCVLMTTEDLYRKFKIWYAKSPIYNGKFLMGFVEFTNQLEQLGGTPFTTTIRGKKGEYKAYFVLPYRPDIQAKKGIGS